MLLVPIYNYKQKILNKNIFIILSYYVVRGVFMLNSFFLAITSSIDSFGIGITYGIKKTKIALLGKIILFIISLSITYSSILLGNITKQILSTILIKILGSIILISIGIYIILEALKKKDNYSNIFNDPLCSDLDNSNTIDSKESLLLALALSLDSFCIGYGGSMNITNINLFPFLVSIFQILFLSIGSFLGNHIYGVAAAIREFMKITT